MRVLLVVLALMAVGVAGCVGTQAPTTTNVPAATTQEGGLSLQAIASGAPDAAAPAPTLATPPVWRQGEWWNVTVHDAFDGAAYSGTRIVAGAEPDNFLVGMPADNFSTELMVLHIPGFGQVSKKDLSFDVHNKNFAPLNFPLTEGKTWDTAFEGRPITAKVHVTSPTVAVIALDGASDHMNVTYDAALGDISAIDYPGYATLAVTGHGYGWTGIVTVPHMFKLVFQQFRIGAALGPGDVPAAPDETVNVDNTFDRVSFVEIVGSALDQLGAPVPAGAGYYEETVTGADGKVYATTLAPPDTSPGLKLGFFSADKPGGVWKFHHVALGPGLAEAEGIAYHVYDIELPSGHVLPSKGMHHHGG